MLYYKYSLFNKLVYFKFSFHIKSNIYSKWGFGVLGFWGFGVY